jgi:hypothetical protein
MVYDVCQHLKYPAITTFACINKLNAANLARRKTGSKNKTNGDLKSTASAMGTIPGRPTLPEASHSKN